MSPDESEAFVTLPKFGQTMESGLIEQWHVANGEYVEVGQVIATVETDKANYDIEAPASGPIQILVQEGEEVAVDTAIGVVGGAPSAVIEKPPEPASPAVPFEPARVANRGAVLASPRAKRRAAELEVDLARVTPSSADGVISAEDVERVAAGGSVLEPPAPGSPTIRQVRERRRMSGIKRTTARRVQEAWQTIPHIVQMVSVDATGLLAEREHLKTRGLEASLNEVLLHLVAQTMADHPDLNAAVEGDEILLFDGVDVGFAVSTPRGLLVPVIRRAGTLTVEELVAESRRLVAAAQAGDLRPDEMGNASLTVSNLGMYEVQSGFPIINLGEAVLVFVGAVEDRPVAIEGRVEICPTLTLSIAFDHRVADGVQAAAFTQALKRAIEGLPSRSAAEQAVLSPRELRGSSPGEEFRVDVEAYGGHRFRLDEPSERGGKDSGPTPVDALLAGLLGCMTISFKFAAQRNGVPIDRIDGRVQANERGHLKSVLLHLEVTSQAPEEDVRALLDRAERGCYVSRALRPDLDVRVELSVVR